MGVHWFAFIILVPKCGVVLVSLLLLQTAFVTMAQQIKRSVDRRGLTGVQLNSSGMQKTGGVRISNSEKLNSLTSKCGCGM